MVSIPQINKYTLEFPDPNSASKDGLVAWGGDLSHSRLIRAYQEGIFPWYNEDDPILWFSPSPRLILELDEFKISKSLKKSMKKFSYSFDADFKKVMQECADIKREGQIGSWIHKDVIEAYSTLFDMGVAHSVESYLDGELVGGLYGVVVGSVFCGESMFSKVSDASKSAFATLIKHLKLWGYSFVDCQVPTSHLKSLGAKEILRDEFLKRLYKHRFDIINNKWEIKSC